MNDNSPSTRTASRRQTIDGHTSPRKHPPEQERVQSPSLPNPSTSSLLIGAKTVAGIGIGLVTVIAGAVIVGAAAETVLIPSLLLKLAGGVAGGGVGMAKGLRDEEKIRET
jgi:hypothetical protein